MARYLFWVTVSLLLILVFSYFLGWIGLVFGLFGLLAGAVSIYQDRRKTKSKT